MPLDAVCLRALIHEIDYRAKGGRIDKIYQPDREEIVLSVRSAGSALKLLISVGASAPRMHFIDASRENPAAPPMFCMLLRKHLQGAKICSVFQNKLERSATIEFDTVDEMGVPAKKYLACELMGKYSNITLFDGENRIIDAIKRVDGDLSTKRQILPGLFYREPPKQDKSSLFEISPAGIAAAISSAVGEQGLDKWLLANFLGLSPLICREISYRATGDAAKPVSCLTQDDKNKLCQVIGDFTEYVLTGKMRPVMLIKSNDKSVFDFTFLPIGQYENLVESRVEDSFSRLLSDFYEKKSNAERIRRRAHDMTKTVVNARDRLSRKLQTQKLELSKTLDRDKNKCLGDLITANLYRIEKGEKRVSVVDYFDETCPEVEISLDIRLTPQQNAQKYFKLYNKAKTAEEILTAQIEQGERELSYLESVLESITEAESETDLAQIREELLETGYLSQKQQHGNKGQKKRPVQAKPFEYRTSDGFSVFAGKNNTQNDLLTLKTAFKSDVWFHTQKIHGSHVILVCDGQAPTNTAMTEAACIAAYHSQARGSAQIPVDYTPVRHIKKPSGAKPGMVIYHVYQTAYVTPVEAEIEKLRVK